MLVSETRSPVSGRASRAVMLPQFTLVGPVGAPVVVVLGGTSASRHVTSAGSNTLPHGIRVDPAGNV